MNSDSKKIGKVFLLYGLIVFVILFCFYAVFEPIAMFDTDDWSHSYILRWPIPIIGAWNPSRVFPEVFEPIVAYIGALFVYPITGNYLYSLTIMHSIFVSFMLSVYFYEYVVLLYRKVTTSIAVCIISGFLFLGLHFIALLHWGGNNTSLLHAWDLSCLYYYTSSTAMNAALAMHVISHGGIGNIKNYSIGHKILVVIWCYFSIFSNLYSSVVLAAYVGADFLMNLYQDLSCKRFSIKSFLSKNKIQVFVLGVWLLSHVIEKTGGRSGSRVGTIPSNIIMTLSWLVRTVFVSNPFAIIFAIVTVVFWVKRCDKNKNWTNKVLLCFFLTLGYLYLLCVVVDSQYISRPDVVIAYTFWVLMALVGCFANLISQNKKYCKLSLILLGSVILFIAGYGKMYSPMNYGNLSYTQCENIMEDIIDQFKTAQEEGKDEIDLYVPKFDSESNWPISASPYSRERYQEAMYRHHIVNRRIIVRDVIPSEEKNKTLIDAYQK